MITDFKQIEEAALGALRRLGRSERTLAGYAEQIRKLAAAHRRHGHQALDAAFVEEYDSAALRMKELGSPGGFAAGRHRRFMRLLRAAAFSDEAGGGPAGLAEAAGLDRSRGAALRRLPAGLFKPVLDFLEWARPRLSPSTFSKYALCVSDFAGRLANAGVRAVADLTPAAMLRALAGASSHAPASIGTYVDGPKLFFKWLRASGLAGSDLSECLRIKVPKRVPVPKAFTRQQSEEMLAAIPADGDGMMLHAFITLLSETGLRGIDAASLRIGDIDWPGRRIVLEQSKTRRQVELPITEKLAWSLSRYLLECRPRGAEGFVFANPRPPFGRVSMSWLKARFRKLRDSALGPGFKGFGFHSFRRGLGSALFEKEVPLFLISQILGHSRTDSSKPYLKADLGHLRECCLPFPGPVGREELRHA